MKIETYEPALQAVKERFDHWRSTRVKRGRIPGELMAMVPQLLKKFPRNRIATALHLSYGELNKLRTRSPEAVKQNNIFAEYSLPLSSNNNHGCSLEFSRQDLAVKISGLTAAHLQFLVPLLMGA